MTKLAKIQNYIMLYHNYTNEESDWVEKATIEEIMKAKEWYENEYPRHDMEFRIIAAGSTEIIEEEKE